MNNNMNHPSSHTPILDSENFDYWKSRIKTIMRSMDEKIWNSCIGGYSHPTKKVEEKQVPKLTVELSREENAALQANNRALDILFSAVDVNEHRKIANCEIAKEAWDILVTCHKGTDVVKQSKLQRLTTEFAIIRMQEDETFNEFYSKLIAIPPFRVIKKILRSLPERFKTKVTMLEGKRKLNEKSVEEVVGIIQTYEADMLQPESLKSKVNYRLRKKTNFKANITWDDNCESDNSEEEQVDHTNFMAFGASLQSNLSDHESLNDSENEGSDEEFSFDELKQSYNMLFEESIKINESNLKMAKNYNNSNKELVRAKKQVEELQVSLSSVTNEKEKLRKQVESLRENNKVLTDLNAASEDKIESLNIGIDNANILFERLNTGSKKLDKILDVQRPTSDKTGLGFYEASPSKIVGGKPNELESKKTDVFMVLPSRLL
ncbi:hypothetical protein RHMOL_Rhmol03G0096600 [Rhododendron molle]|uniref:Uncharacterized protein n=1 Tax=Rhododendron molle TaxID=49168 RepID=A0ACC0PCT2_RHOML|nr:hypothetical protein RHMOL_Rhmol03G0096600 [Rhododendron molle]